jgi:hypothetical protein
VERNRLKLAVMGERQSPAIDRGLDWVATGD